MTHIFFLVSWTLFFRANNESVWYEQGRRARFREKSEAIAFIRRSPEEGVEYECVNSITGEMGFCKIYGIFPEKIKRGEQEESYGYGN